MNHFTCLTSNLFPPHCFVRLSLALFLSLAYKFKKYFVDVTGNDFGTPDAKLIPTITRCTPKGNSNNLQLLKTFST